MSVKKNPLPKSRVGDRAWLVEWCHFRYQDEDGTGDPDRDQTSSRRFASREEAMAYAKEVYPQDQYGAVMVTQVEFTPYDEDDVADFPHAGFWEATADTEYYEGEE